MFTNNFDPVAFNILSLEFRWYSLAYIAGILIGWVYCKKKLIKGPPINKTIMSEVNKDNPVLKVIYLNTFKNPKVSTKFNKK